MTGEERRQAILNSIKQAKGPVSGTALAEKYRVSRQVIVQDIALLRAAHHDIHSTNRGYLIQGKVKYTRTFLVFHTDDEIEDELNCIVDMGGQVIDVVVEHAVYGHLSAELGIASRREVEGFIEEIRSGKSQPLKNLTSGRHYHTVEAESENVLDLIEAALKKREYLITEQ